MIKHRYEVSGIICSSGNEFKNVSCITDDIMKVILLFRKDGMSPHSIVRMEQVSKDAIEGIIYEK